jgi:hypothetical protein
MEALEDCRRRDDYEKTANPPTSGRSPDVSPNFRFLPAAAPNSPQPRRRLGIARQRSTSGLARDMVVPSLREAMSIRKRAWKTAKGVEKQAWTVDYVDQAGARQIKTFGRKK